MQRLILQFATKCFSDNVYCEFRRSISLERRKILRRKTLTLRTITEIKVNRIRL